MLYNVRMLVTGAACDEVNVDGYHCLDNRDKLPVLSFVSTLEGLV